MIHSLDITQFRSHKKSSYLFSEGVNIIIGENGSGKTNIIEAIYLLSQGKSFLGAKLKDTINWEKQEFSIIKTVTDNHELEYILDNRAGFKRIAKIDGGQIALKYFAGKLPVVLFEPMDLHLVTGSPSLRRDFIDRIISQISLEYRMELKQFHRLIVQRNALLKKIRAGEASTNELDQWDNLLSPIGRNIITHRKELFAFIDQHIAETVDTLQEENHIIKYDYLPSVRHEEHYYEVLRDRRNLDISAGVTLNGPHRDDFQISFDGREASTFASRGEQRLCCISLLMIERLLIKKHIGQEPIFLCDDVLSELDEQRQKMFLDAISDCQVIITSAVAMDKENVNIIEI